MKLLELTLATPAENLALDEALLEAAEAGEQPEDVLRLWESTTHVAVLGRSSDPETEVDLTACRQHKIPILRRGSGGTTVLIGPGCLMYAVLLSYQRYPALRMIEKAHQFVLQQLRQAIQPQVAEIHCEGTSDLARNRDKFSGNSLKCRQRHLLYHGTILYDFSTDLMGQCLGTPARQPEYRAGRTHQQFVANLPLDPGLLRKDLARVWGASSPLETWPAERTARLAEQRYSEEGKWRIKGG